LYFNTYLTLNILSSAWLCCVALEEIKKITTIKQSFVSSSKLVQQFLNILIKAHSSLVDLTYKQVLDQFDDANNRLNEDLLSKRCLNVIDIIRSSISDRSINEDLLKTQETMCQILVLMNPLDSFSLLLLGCSKLEIYDFLLDRRRKDDENVVSQKLNESLNSLLESIRLQKDLKSCDPSESITGENKT
jgi:hypothetical protein